MLENWRRVVWRFSACLGCGELCGCSVVLRTEFQPFPCFTSQYNLGDCRNPRRCLAHSPNKSLALTWTQTLVAFIALQMVLLHSHSGEPYHSECKSRLFQDFSSAVVYFLRLAGNLLYSPGGLKLTAILFAQSPESRCYKCEPPHLAHVQTELWQNSFSSRMVFFTNKI